MAGFSPILCYWGRNQINPIKTRFDVLTLSPRYYSVLVLITLSMRLWISYYNRPRFTDNNLESKTCTWYLLRVCMYVWSSHTYSRVWINRVRLSILLVVSWTGKKMIFPCPRACLRICSRETGSAVPSRVSLLISILRLNLVLTYGIPPEFRGGAHLWNRHTSSCQSRVYRVTHNCVPMALTAESPPAQGQ